jgi:hypothetical protein
MTVANVVNLKTINPKVRDRRYRGGRLYGVALWLFGAESRRFFFAGGQNGRPTGAAASDDEKGTASLCCLGVPPPVAAVLTVGLFPKLKGDKCGRAELVPPNVSARQNVAVEGRVGKPGLTPMIPYCVTADCRKLRSPKDNKSDGRRPPRQKQKKKQYGPRVLTRGPFSRETN